MGIFYSSYQCIDPPTQCNHVGPYRYTADPESTQPLGLQPPQSYLDAVEGKTDDEIKALMSYTGTESNMTDEQRMQGICNVLGGGTFRMCCDPTRTDIVNPERVPVRFKITKDSSGKIEAILACSCSPDDQECLQRDCPEPQFTKRLTEYEYCKTVPKNEVNGRQSVSGSSNTSRQYLGRELLPDCYAQQCLSTTQLTKIELQEPAPVDEGSGLASTTPSGTSQTASTPPPTVTPLVAEKPPMTIDDHYTRIIYIVIFVMCIIFCLFAVVGVNMR